MPPALTFFDRTGGAVAPSLEAIFWDVDGTLAETELEGHRVAYNLALSMAESGEWSRTQFYLARMHAAGARTAESLWLAIKAAQRLGDAPALAQLAAQLRTEFPKSPQAQWYERKAFDE